MSDQDTQRLVHGSAYSKRRCAQLQDDVTNLSAEVERMRQQLEHAAARRLASTAPNPLLGGQ